MVFFLYLSKLFFRFICKLKQNLIKTSEFSFELVNNAYLPVRRACKFQSLFLRLLGPYHPESDVLPLGYFDWLPEKLTEINPNLLVMNKSADLYLYFFCNCL